MDKLAVQIHNEIMQIDAKKTLKRLEERKSDRGRVTLYLSKGLYTDFRKACGKHAASEVIEELMRHFIASEKSVRR